jgi:alpha-ketoglutarate-dependent taurine dioxygenase
LLAVLPRTFADIEDVVTDDVVTDDVPSCRKTRRALRAEAHNGHRSTLPISSCSHRLAQHARKDLTMALSVTKLSVAMGVRVDYDLRVPMGTEDQQELSELLDQHQLLLFRDQHLEPSEHVRVVRYVGDVIDTNDVISNVDPDGKKLQEGELVFHQDLAFSEIPLFGISLYGKTVTDDCAPTRYANVQRAVSLLPSKLHGGLSGMTAMHACVRIRDDIYGSQSSGRIGR